MVHVSKKNEELVYNFIFHALGPFLENRGGAIPIPCLLPERQELILHVHVSKLASHDG